MRRREFIELFGGALMAWPLAANAQPATVPVIGFLNSEAAHGYYAPLAAAFRRGLQDSGFNEGENVAIEYRWAEGQYDRLPALAADLVGRGVAVLAVNTPAARIAKEATARIPIVFYTTVDPVDAALVASLGRPGGNLTGVSGFNVEVGPKRLELLHELVPAARQIGLLVNPSNRLVTEVLIQDVQAAARALRLSITVLNARSEAELEAAFASMAEQKVDALTIGADAFLSGRSEQLGALALRHRIPAIFQTREFAAAGGLMSYSTGATEAFHQMGVYTARILKGEKPADLPVVQPTRLALVINLQTAKALGLEVPMSLLMRVDEVIE
jgi:putative ABC transport system substrate-binding protein